MQRNKQFHDLVRDYLVKGDGGPFCETFQELFEPTEGEKGTGKESQSAHHGLGRSEIKAVMENYCNVRSGHNANGRAANDPNPELKTSSKALLQRLKMRKHIRQQLLNSDDSQIVACLIEKNYPRLWNENKKVEASLLSIDFISYVKKGKVEKALEILSRPPLARPSGSAFSRAQSLLNDNIYCEAHRNNSVQQS